MENDDDLVRIVVRQHPDLEGRAGARLVTVELHYPDADEPETVVMEAEAFNQLASVSPMAEVLRGAKRVARTIPSQAVAPVGAKEQAR